jgi:hypothetical protein
MDNVQKVDDCANILSSQTLDLIMNKGWACRAVPSPDMKRLQGVSEIPLCCKTPYIGGAEFLFTVSFP